MLKLNDAHKLSKNDLRNVKGGTSGGPFDCSVECTTEEETGTDSCGTGWTCRANYCGNPDPGYKCYKNRV